MAWASCSDEDTFSLCCWASIISVVGCRRHKDFYLLFQATLFTAMSRCIGIGSANAAALRHDEKRLDGDG